MISSLTANVGRLSDGTNKGTINLLAFTWLQRGYYVVVLHYSIAKEVHDISMCQGTLVKYTYSYCQWRNYGTIIRSTTGRTLLEYGVLDSK